MNISQTCKKNHEMSNIFAKQQTCCIINPTLSANQNHHIERNSSIILTTKYWQYYRFIDFNTFFCASEILF